MGGKRVRWLLGAFLLGALAAGLWVLLFRRRRALRLRETSEPFELILKSVPMPEPSPVSEPEPAAAPAPSVESGPVPEPVPAPDTANTLSVLSPAELRGRDPNDETPFAAACPQHLSDVKGIGSVFESRLYEAGIGSFWDLSQLSDVDLMRILKLTDLQARSIDLSRIREDACRLAVETKSKGRMWTRHAPDDFEPLQGIGRTFEKRLYDAGICTYDALADTTVELLEEICHAPAQFKPDYQSWIDQAKALAAARTARHNP